MIMKVIRVSLLKISPFFSCSIHTVNPYVVLFLLSSLLMYAWNNIGLDWFSNQLCYLLIAVAFCFLLVLQVFTLVCLYVFVPTTSCLIPTHCPPTASFTQLLFLYSCWILPNLQGLASSLILLLLSY